MATTLTSAIENVRKSIKENATPLLGADSTVTELSKNLETLESFVTGHTEDPFQSSILQELDQEMRDNLQEAEDAVDEYVYSASQHRNRGEPEEAVNLIAYQSKIGEASSKIEKISKRANEMYQEYDKIRKKPKGNRWFTFIFWAIWSVIQLFTTLCVFWVLVLNLQGKGNTKRSIRIASCLGLGSSATPAIGFGIVLKKESRMPNIIGFSIALAIFMGRLIIFILAMVKCDEDDCGIGAWNAFDMIAFAYGVDIVIAFNNRKSTTVSISQQRLSSFLEFIQKNRWARFSFWVIWSVLQLFTTICVLWVLVLNLKGKGNTTRAVQIASCLGLVSSATPAIGFGIVFRKRSMSNIIGLLIALTIFIGRLIILVLIMVKCDKKNCGIGAWNAFDLNVLAFNADIFFAFKNRKISTVSVSMVSRWLHEFGS